MEDFFEMVHFWQAVGLGGIVLLVFAVIFSLAFVVLWAMAIYVAVLYHLLRWALSSGARTLSRRWLQFVR